jgi:hypothetical protein
MSAEFTIPRALPWHRRLLLLASVLIATGCQTPTDRVLTYARDNGLREAVLSGKGYRHETFEWLTADRGLLWVFIEGDGTPWEFGGTVVARDPTPRRPLMLGLMAGSPESVLYVGRPCYFQVLRDPECEPSAWTSGRYSRRVVESLAAVVNEYVVRHGFERVVLAGHSGGGTLAVLAAPSVSRTVGVVTLSANLDIDAWTKLHRYLPLSGSLNPVDQPKLPAGIQEWHAVGEKDENVPPSINARYWERVAAERVLRFPEATHACCWGSRFPDIANMIRAALGAGVHSEAPRRTQFPQASGQHR